MKFRPLPRPRRGQTHRCRRQKPQAVSSFRNSAKGKSLRRGEITAVGPGGRDEAGKLIPIDLKGWRTACCSAKWSGNRGQDRYSGNC